MSPIQQTYTILHSECKGKFFMIDLFVGHLIEFLVTCSYFEKWVPIRATFNFGVTSATWWVNEVVTDYTYCSKNKIEITTNGFIEWEEFNSHGLILGVVANYVHEHCQLFFYRGISTIYE